MSDEFTPGPYESAIGSYGIGRVKQWTIVRHQFPKYPYEGELNNEWGIYPPLGECGPVALVAGEENARLLSAAPDLYAALIAVRDSEHKLPAGLWEKVNAAILKAEGKLP